MSLSFNSDYRATLTSCPNLPNGKLSIIADIIEQTKVRKKQRYIHQTWAFRRLQKMIEYKAVWSNIPVVYIQPQYTSQVCPKCLSTNKRVKHNYKCKYCGYEANADYVATINIAKKFLEGISFQDSAPINRAVGFPICEPKAVIDLKAKKSVKLEGVSPPMTEVKGIRNTDIL